MSAKKIATSVAYFGVLLLLSGLIARPLYSAEPGIDIFKRWTAATWTSGDPPTTILYHNVMIVDHDGISSDGTSHVVTVTYPNGGPTYTLKFAYRIGTSRAKYYFHDNTDPSSNHDTYSGTYTYRVTRVPSGVYSEASDYLEVAPVNPPIDKTVSPPVFDWSIVPEASYYRISIYDSDGRWVYSGYVKSPPYKLPPGILKPNATYKYEILAVREPQWFEEDNIGASNMKSFVTGPVVAQAPYIDLHGHGVFTWYHSSPFGVYTYFYLYLHDAQGVPGNIDSVTALFPDQSTLVNLYPDYNVSSTCAVYKGVYFGAIQPGLYQFTVIDRDGHSDTKSEILTPDPVEAPPLSSLIPEDGEVIGSTGMSFEWGAVPGAAFYQVDIYDKDFHHLYWAKTISPHLTFPSGVLQEQSLYRYRILTRGEFFEDNLDNMSAMPWDGVWRANTFLTTQKSGSLSNPPTIDLGNIGVALEEMPHPAKGTALYSLQFGVTVTDPDGVPENIKSVEVIYPDGQTTHLLKYDDVPGAFNYYWEAPEATDPSSIQSGTYTFRAEDFEGHIAIATDELGDVAASVLAWPTNALPVDGTRLTGTTPLITWNAVSNASYYKVRIMSAWTFPTVHWSEELTDTNYLVPQEILSPNTTYSYRIYAFREPSGSEFDFFSCNRSWFMTDYHFTTGSQGLVDSDGDGVPDDFEVATCLNPNSVDTDGDGIIDGDEDANHNGILDTGETNPCNADTDADGMPDKWEKDNNLNPTVDDALLDNDGDGYSNLREFISGSSPNTGDATLPTIGTFDSDQDSDGKDLQAVVSEFNRQDCSEADPCSCDLDGDGDVDMVDVALFAEDFGRSE